LNGSFDSRKGLQWKSFFGFAWSATQGKAKKDCSGKPDGGAKTPGFGIYFFAAGTPKKYYLWVRK
jgi:hypothetical protein